MAKRFTDTEKWKDPWFRKLPIEAKLFWIFILDNCDEAGFWKIDLELVSFYINYQINEDIIKMINDGKERVQKIGDRLFIKEFAEFQYGSFRKSVHPFHKKLVKLIDKRYPIDRVCHTLQDKDKDKDKDKEEDKDKRKDLPEWLELEIWNEWEKHRKELKKKLTPTTIKRQIKFLEENKDNYKQIIIQSIQNGWTGLFPLKEKVKKSNFGRLHDGTKVEYKFGRWVDVQNPNAKFDLSYYKEIANDSVISEEDWQKGKRYNKLTK